MLGLGDLHGNLAAFEGQFIGAVVDHAAWEFEPQIVQHGQVDRAFAVNLISTSACHGGPNRSPCAGGPARIVAAHGFQTGYLAFQRR